MTCICIDDLNPASFRGVGFWIASEKLDYGRRDVIHEYPMRDDPYIEDMGEKAQKISVDGYLFGDDWKAQRDAIVAACRARGPALLQLPTDAPKMVACLTVSVSRTKDECGFYRLAFEFVAAKNFGVPTAVGMIESLIGNTFNSAISAFTSFFDQTFQPLNTAQWAVDNQVGRVAQLSQDIIGAVESSPSINDTLSASVVQTAIGLFQNAEAYSQPDPDTSVRLAGQNVPAQVIGRVGGDAGYTVISPSGIDVSSGAAAVVPVIAYAFNTLGNSLTVDAAISALTTFATWSVNETTLDQVQARTTTAVPSTPSVSDLVDVNNGTLFCGVVRSFALMKLAQALAAKTFLSRSEAIQARANVVELFNMQIAEFEEDAIVNTLLSARDAAVKAITNKMATVVPVIQIAANVSKPSLYWAARLYDDVGRAEELADRNHVSAPAFMPPTFEALAR